MITGDGLAAALAGVECVIDAVAGPSPEQQAATAFFTTAARNLHQACLRAGVRRMIVVSIIGTDRFTARDGPAKIAHERAMLAGPVPVRVLRAAQFHELVAQLVDWGTRGEVAYVPRMRTQLVAARAVAEVPAHLATAPGPGTGPFLEVASPGGEPGRDGGAARLASRLPGEDRGGSDPADPDRELNEKAAPAARPRRRHHRPHLRRMAPRRPNGLHYPGCPGPFAARHDPAQTDTPAPDPGGAKPAGQQRSHERKSLMNVHTRREKVRFISGDTPPPAAADLPRQFGTVAAAAEGCDALVAAGVMPAGVWL